MPEHLEDAPGWDAVESRVRRAVAGLEPGEPLHWGSGSLPDQDGPYGINAYAADSVWLYVTLGMTELFTKVSDDAAISGWGFELTMRVPRTPGSPAPDWPVATLQQLGSHVFATGSPFADGHRITTGPLPTDQGAEPLTALAITLDPELGEMSTPFGHMSFLTVVGVTAAELAQMQAASTAEVVARLRDSSPLLVTGAPR